MLIINKFFSDKFPCSFFAWGRLIVPPSGRPSQQPIKTLLLGPLANQNSSRPRANQKARKRPIIQLDPDHRLKYVTANRNSCYWPISQTEKGSQFIIYHSQLNSPFFRPYHTEQAVSRFTLSPLVTLMHFMKTTLCCWKTLIFVKIWKMLDVRTQGSPIYQIFNIWQTWG